MTRTHHERRKPRNHHITEAAERISHHSHYRHFIIISILSDHISAKIKTHCSAIQVGHMTAGKGPNAINDRQVSAAESGCGDL